jgi:hypothetical protein
MQIQDIEQPMGDMTSTGKFHSAIRESNAHDDDLQTELWRIVSVKHNGVGLLFSFPVRDNKTGGEVMERLRRQFGASKVNQCVNRIFFFREQALFIGTISLVSSRCAPIKQAADVSFYRALLQHLSLKFTECPSMSRL